jgi:hypothetical protein
MVYSLGFPLTYIVLGFPSYAGRLLEDGDNWWAIPLVDVLFVLQWVIWSQLLARLIRRGGSTTGLK